MPGTSEFCPAKINLTLAVTGRRADGFHELVSLVAPIDVGDTLCAERCEADAGAHGAGTAGVAEAAGAGPARFTLHCSDAALPADESNLVLRAAHAFAVAAGWEGRVAFSLEKHLPVGAGLGGGSSDAAGALRALNHLAGAPLAPAALADVAARVGSDVPLFLAGGPVVMRGRGEVIEPVATEVAARLRGRRVAVWKPAFGVSTPWAYGALAAGAPATYRDPAEAEAELAVCLRAIGEGAVLPPLVNSFEAPVFAKFVALPALAGELRERFGLEPALSGSGSACFAFLPDGAPEGEIAAVVRAACGSGAFFRIARIL